jgi:hypothetical protein
LKKKKLKIAVEESSRKKAKKLSAVRKNYTATRAE